MGKERGEIMFKGLYSRGQTKWKYPEPSASHSFSPFGLWGRGTSANSYLEKTLLTYLHIFRPQKGSFKCLKSSSSTSRVLEGSSWDGQGCPLHPPLLFQKSYLVPFGIPGEPACQNLYTSRSYTTSNGYRKSNIWEQTFRQMRISTAETALFWIYVNSK